jgi:hypothetical protein
VFFVSEKGLRSHMINRIIISQAKRRISGIEMKRILILLVLLILTVFVFAGDDDDANNRTDSTLPPVFGEITVKACSTTDI